MRVVIQRVEESAVYINDTLKSKIGRGLNILLGIEECDTDEDINWLVSKISKLRIFPDENQHMNLDIFSLEKPEVLIISQFTLHASTRKGNRPSFIKAAKPDIAVPLYNRFIEELKSCGLLVKTGTFAAEMKVHIINNGPVTIIIDSKNKE